MFTGLVECAVPVHALDSVGPGKRLILAVPQFAAHVTIGESIAVNGCCLTVVGIEAELLHFEAGPETLRLTNLGELLPGQLVNVERSLRLGDRLGGHLVTGHIDGTGTLARRMDNAAWSDLWFTAPGELLRQMVRKGSITVDGVSLTLVAVSDTEFCVQLIPHTLAVTTLGIRQPGERVNLETDLLAKYVERQLAPRT
ncbi:MAG: riboflavin synthase [Pirellulales bacterium]|nr:riboflavin synthase [Pirellulales bacterium]